MKESEGCGVYQTSAQKSALFFKDTVGSTMLVDSAPAVTVAQGPSQRSYTLYIDFHSFTLL